MKKYRFMTYFLFISFLLPGGLAFAGARKEGEKWLEEGFRTFQVVAMESSHK